MNSVADVNVDDTLSAGRRQSSVRKSWPPSMRDRIAGALERSREVSRRERHVSHYLKIELDTAHLRVMDLEDKRARDSVCTRLLSNEFNKLRQLNRELTAALETIVVVAPPTAPPESSPIIEAVNHLDAGRAGSVNRSTLMSLVTYGTMAQMELQRSRTCIACCLAEVGVVNVPCGHSCMCTACADIHIAKTARHHSSAPDERGTLDTQSLSGGMTSSCPICRIPCTTQRIRFH